MPIQEDHVIVSMEHFSAGVNVTPAKAAKGREGQKGYKKPESEKRSFFASFGAGTTYSPNAGSTIEGVAATFEEIAATDDPKATLLLIARHLRKEATAAVTAGEHAAFLTDTEPGFQGENAARMQRWYKGGMSLYLSSAAAGADEILP